MKAVLLLIFISVGIPALVTFLLTAFCPRFLWTGPLIVLSLGFMLIYFAEGQYGQPVGNFIHYVVVIALIISLFLTVSSSKKNR